MQNFNERMTYIMSKWGGPTLSDMTGISRTQLHRLKSDGNETTRPNLLKISQVCGIELEWLMSGTGPIMKGDPEPTPPPPPEFSADEIEMINLFRAAPLQTKLKAFQVLSEG